MDPQTHIIIRISEQCFTVTHTTVAIQYWACSLVVSTPIQVTNPELDSCINGAQTRGGDINKVVILFFNLEML
jgi:hypothetical protein